MVEILKEHIYSKITQKLVKDPAMRRQMSYNPVNLKLVIIHFRRSDVARTVEGDWSAKNAVSF